MLSTYRFKHSSGTGDYHHGNGGVRGLGMGNAGGDGGGNHNKNRNPDVQNDWAQSLAQSRREVCKETKRSPAVC